MKRANSDLQIKTFSDREILAVMNDLNPDYVVASELSQRIFGLNGNDEEQVRRHAARCVTARLVWMSRYGLVESVREKLDEERRWSISEMGRALRFTHLGRSLSSAITNTPETSVLELTHQVSERMLGAGDVAGRAMRREFQHQITRRRWR
jgi:hypothetical protein